MAEQIQFNQGDEYIFRLNGFNPEHNYAIYTQMFDEDGNFVGQQIETTTNFSDSVEVVFPASYTDTLTVPVGEDYQLYYLGGKQAEIITSTVTSLYGWTYSGNTIYTKTDTPAVGTATYDEEGTSTGDNVTAITTSEDVVTSITADSVTYTRDSEADITTEVTTYNSEKTIISDLANKRPVIVFKKRAEGPN